VGVSGGPDSVCLLNILNELKKKYGLEIVVAHVNYNLRGKDSRLDQKTAKDLARASSLPIEVLNYKTGKKSANSEEELRNARYIFFEKVRKRYEADKVAVGHNLNDQAETVLMRILRGTGLRGLGAIKFKNNSIVRPLLNIPRKDILEHLRKNRIKYRTDKTNLDSEFLRNKIRNELIPYLEKGFNPNVQEILYKLSLSISEDYDFISRYSFEWLRSEKYLSVSALRKLHPSIRREAIRLAIEKIIPSLKEIEAGHVEEVLKIIRSEKNKSQKISIKNLKIIRRGDRLIIAK
jgi:tRNA(Ile)-lysidine synthase